MQRSSQCSVLKGMLPGNGKKYEKKKKKASNVKRKKPGSRKALDFVSKKISKIYSFHNIDNHHYMRRSKEEKWKEKEEKLKVQTTLRKWAL